MAETLVISRKPPEATALNYAELREIGIAYFERVASGLWTDYNVHDPGITLLELLCYAITEVSYRTTFPDEDLFAPAPGENVPSGAIPPLVTARFALTNGPVTINDYRKLFLDAFPELRNVWLDVITQELFADTKKRELVRVAGPDTITFEIRGLYRARLLFHDGVAPARRTAVIQELQRFYYRHRNLCEDLAEVVITPLEDIMVCAEIQLTAEADIEATHAQVVFELRRFLSPIVPRYSLADLMERGLPPEEIFEGPRLENGFILDDDLDAAGAHTSVRASDLMAVILAVPGVKAVTKFQLNRPPVGGEPSEPVDWELPLTPGFHPQLTLENSRLHFYKGPLPFHSDVVEVRATLALLEEEAAKNTVAGTLFDREIPPGIWRDLGDFTTLQNSLPLCYGVGLQGFDSKAEPARMAKARQLQAFLLIFDQMLANFLAQLTHVRALFAPDFSADPERRRSFFPRAVADLPDLHRILSSVAENDNATTEEVAAAYEQLIASAVTVEDPASEYHWVTRRSQILEHLLARFGESFTDEVLMHYAAEGARSGEQVLEAKRAFFADLPSLAYNRLKAADILDATQVWDTPNVSGFEKRLGRLIGLASSDRRNLTTIVYDFYEEIDTDSKSEIRFRIVDTRNKKTILSGTRRFANKEEAEAEMRIAIRLAMETLNYRLKVAEDGRHFFVIVHEVDGVEDIVAMRKEFWATLEEAEAERDRVIELISREYSEEGLFLVEHLLMRPRTGSPPNWTLLPPACACVEGGEGGEEAACKTGPQSWDPYSFRVHLIFPGYTARFSEPGFRRSVEDIVHRELPAHLIAKICFVGKEELAVFEREYRLWLESIASGEASAAALKRLIDSLNELHTIYPAGTLHDCKEDADEASAVVLNQSRLGTLPPETDEDNPPPGNDT